jgi:hypothetical protein
MVAMMQRSFTVSGRGAFPLDMLRYDSCWPNSEADTSAIDEPRERRKVTLRTYSNYSPTIDRWESFGWRVDDDGRG